MKMRLTILVLCALAIALAWLLWPTGENRAPATAKTAVASVPSLRATSASPATNAAAAMAATAATGRSADSTNRLTFRLSNTTKTIGELTAAPNAILLENALIETDAKADLKIPAHLRASGEPGAYIVQARGEIGAAFRAALTGAGGEIVSYIPNNAYLVRLSAAGAAELSGNALVQAVLPYEPYFKVQSSLLGLAVEQKPLPAETFLTLGLFTGGATATKSEIEKLGGEILATNRSPFGELVRVRPPADWIALAQLPGVQVLDDLAAAKYPMPLPLAHTDDTVVGRIRADLQSAIRLAEHDLRSVNDLLAHLERQANRPQRQSPSRRRRPPRSDLMDELPF